MEHSAEPAQHVRNPVLDPTSARKQVFRAWILVMLGFVGFIGLALVTGSSIYSYILGGTQARTSTLEPVSGQNVLMRSPGDENWQLITDRTTISEGDTIATGSATTSWVTLFDQGTIEVSENSLVQIKQMRTSRMFRDQKVIEIEPIRGSIYVGMAPRGEFNVSEMRVAVGPVTVRMRDEIRGEQAGSFLVETQRMSPTGDADDPLLSVRVAVLRGQAEVVTPYGTRTLGSNQQVLIDDAGHHGDITPAKRELIRNGDFSRHLADWVEYHDHGSESPDQSGTVERVPVDGKDVGSNVALQIRRSAINGDNWETGVRQTIGQSLRVHSSLHLSMRLRIDEQRPLGGGDQLTEYPLIVKINYVDLNGENREWWHGFYIQADPDNPVPDDRATLVERSEWVPVSLDLRNLTPLPRQITSILIYGSGHSYRTEVTDISLTSSETAVDEYD